MIEKMRFLSITGPLDDLDRVLKDYLSRYEMHVENTLYELQNVGDLRPLNEASPYRAPLARIEKLLGLFPEDELPEPSKMTGEQAMSILHALENSFDQFSLKARSIEVERQSKKDLLQKVRPFVGLGFDIEEILHFRTIKFRFGRISKDYAEKFLSYVYDNIESLFIRCDSDENYVYGVAFVPTTETSRVDAIYKSMHFERIYVPDEYHGTPAENVKLLEGEIATLTEQIESLNADRRKALSDRKKDLVSAYTTLKELDRTFDLRKMAAVTDSRVPFYILCQWMPEKEAKVFLKEIESDEKVICITEGPGSTGSSTPPTKLRNPAIVRPFEMLVTMYGIPNYNEFDPTFLVALLYSLTFGWMFGDAGQGGLLLLGGILLYLKKKSPIYAILATCGFFSVLFGISYASFFGFEHLWEPLWLRPTEAMTTLPLFGKLNTIFVVAVLYGIGLILLSMLLNIINCIRAKSYEELVFGKNGLAGFIFYATVIALFILYMAGHDVRVGILAITLMVVPLILIVFREPLMALIEKHKPKEKTGVAMFLISAFFELFEILLSFFSNTVSYVRVGAFAVCHATMMGVVMMFAGAENGAHINWVVVVLGNLFVAGLEGLIVAIQSLRLQYYEFFSHFYQGNGRAFRPSLKPESK